MGVSPDRPLRALVPRVLVALLAISASGALTGDGGRARAAGDATPPVISAIATVPALTSATVTWTTDEPATSVVEYGTKTKYGSAASSKTLVTTHSMPLTGLACGTTYNFRVRSVDAAGNAATSANNTFTTTTCPDTTPPVISAIAAAPAATSATVSWTTNEPATSAADYGKTTTYGSTATSATLVTSHSLTLTGLVCGTTYNFRVRSADAAGNAATSPNQTFTTSACPPPDTTPPAISSIAASSTQTSATVSWSTNEPATSAVDYGTTTAYGTTATSPTLVASHSLPLSGLACETTYNFRVRSTDAAGNAATSSNQTFTTAQCPDTTPPVLSAVAATADETSATVSWTTNEPATSAVDYGTTTAYGSTAAAAAVVTGHSVALTGLVCGTTYHYRVRSSDAAGNAASSADAVFTTDACASTPPPPTAGRLRSDEFNGSALDLSLWRVVDPVGDAEVGAAGGAATIALPAGVAHDFWAGALTAPRLLQGATNEDFEVEVKLLSPPALQYQLQGVVVQEDLANLLRLEVHHNGGELNVFAASFQNGEPTVRVFSSVGARSEPFYLRVKRVGDSWTLSYSRDAQEWTVAGSFEHALTVADVGVFAGNTGAPPPAFNAGFDYFRVLSIGGTASDTTPPTISAISSTAAATSATVVWTTNEPATSAVDYGTTTAYGTSAGAATLVTNHSITITGITCATTYQFRVRSTDAAGNRATSGDRTLTTGACPSGVVSDEFDATLVDRRLWRLVDPLGDSSLNQGNGRLALTVAGGAAHDLWTGALNAPRLLQAVPNADFEIEAKFDSAVSQPIQIQGLVAQQDQGNFVRFDVYSNGTEIRLFGATFAGGVGSSRLDQAIVAGSPIYLRIRRAGDTWTLLYSRAGRVWTQVATFAHQLAVAEVGLFAGNNGLPPSASPALASTVDYFHNAQTAPPPPPDTTPPVVGTVTVSPGVDTAVVNWTTNEAASGTVAFGKATTYGRVANGPFGLSHRVVVTGLACETEYHFSARSTDEDGNTGASPDGTFTTATCPPPIHDDEFTGSILDTSWRFKDALGDSTLAGPTAGAVEISVPAGPEHDVWTEANHAPRLVQATRDEDFEVEVRFDSPVAQRYQMEGLLVEQDDANLLRFELHSDGARTSLYAAAVSGGIGQTKHSSIVDGGGPVQLRVKRAGSKWTFRYSRDGLAWTAPVAFAHPLTVTAVGPFVGSTGRPAAPGMTGRIDYFRVLSLGTPPPDTTAPVVSSVATSTDVEAATVTWLTNEPARATLRYGKSTSYGSTASSSELLTSHRFDLADLSCATVYHFEIVVTDEAGNEGRTADRTFTTGVCPPPDVTPPAITAVAVQPNVRSASVTWATDERAHSRVEFGLNATYGGAVEDGTLVTTHRMSLSSLECDTTYHFRVVSRDKAGNLAASTDATFRTAVCPPPGGPLIDVWYGDDHVFGARGTPQNWANIVGHVSDPDGVARVTYSLNGSPATQLVIDPEYSVRIAQFGDFNVELDVAELVGGTNQVEIVATDRAGYRSTRVVTVRYSGSNSWPQTYTANWGSAAKIADVAQVVDGLWRIDGGDVRPAEPGYDRVLAIGERSWQNYEVTVPFTINALSSTSQHAGFGIATGWQGHAGSQRPRFEYPFGLLCFYYRNFRGDDYHLWLMGSDDSFIVNDGGANHLALGTRYVMKMRTENIGGGMSRYSCKVWPAQSPEPGAWSVTADRPSRSGSAILVQDFADVSLGSVAIRPIAAPVEPPPAITDVSVSPSPTSAWIRWNTDKAATTTVEYGRTSAYGFTHFDDSMTQEHALALWGLDCGTTYRYRLTSTDAGGRTGATADRSFTTAACSSTLTGYQRQVVDAGAVRPHAKALGDLNGDGLADAIYGQLEGGSGGLYWYEAPNWTRRTINPTGQYKEDMQTADVDGDGDTDIVVGTLVGIRWFVNPLRQGGDPRSQGWETRTINGDYTHDIELADVDKDGRIDVASEFGVYVQTAAGGWNLVGASSIDRDPAYYGTGMGDVNGDGYPDLVASGPHAPHPIVWYENPVGAGRPVSSTWQRRAIGPAPLTASGPMTQAWKGSFVVADVNGDGRADVVSVPMYYYSGLRWFESRADASGGVTWTPHLIDNSFRAVHTFEAADVNRDGALDFVLVEQEQSTFKRVSVLYGSKGAASWSLDVLARTGGHNTKIGDVDGDGGVDILVANHGYYGAATPLEVWRAGAPAGGVSAASTGPLASFLAFASPAPAASTDSAVGDARFLCDLP